MRLSAGRTKMNTSSQALAFLAGANSIFQGEQLLTTPNQNREEDKYMFENLGLNPIESIS